MKNTYLLIIIAFILQQGGLAQEIKPKQSIDEKELKKIKEDWRFDVDMGFNFTVSEVQLTGDYPKNSTELEQRKQALEQQFEKEPEDAEVVRRLATFYEGKKREEYLEKAYTIVNQNIEKGQNLGENYFRMGEIFHTAEYYENSYKAYQQAAELIPDSSKVWLRLASFAMNQKQYEEVERTTGRAIALDPENISAHIIYFQTIFFKALESFAQTENPNAKIGIDYSKLEALSRKFPEKKVYKVLEKAGHVLEVFYKVMLKSASAMKEGEDPDYANFFKPSTEDLAKIKDLEQFFEKALRKNTASTLFIKDVLSALCLLQNKVKESEEYLTQIVNIDKVSTEYYDNLAFVYTIQEKWKEAEDIIRKKMIINTTLQDYSTLALLSYKRADFEATRNIIKEIEEKFPEDPRPYSLGAVLEYKDNKLERAYKYCGKVLDLDQDNAKMHLLQGLIALEQEEWQEAYEALTESEKRHNEKAAYLKKKYFEK